MLVFTLAKKSFTKSAVVAGLLVATLIVTQSAHADWNVDFSRRAKSTRDTDLNNVEQTSARGPASVQPAENVGAAPAPEKGIFDTIFDAGEPVQEIVILNTERGFVPGTVRVRKNGHYKITVVNVNEKEKNVSFILDGFSEHHATYYGKIKTFLLDPKKDGVFSFQSPETAAEGKLVVFNPQATIRAPSSETQQ